MLQPKLKKSAKILDIYTTDFVLGNRSPESIQIVPMAINLTQSGENIVGNIYGRLTVLGYCGRKRTIREDRIATTAEYTKYWKCLCTCGKTCVRSGASLKQSAKKGRQTACKTCATSLAARHSHAAKKDKLFSPYTRVLHRIYASYKTHARLRKVSFAISKDVFAEMLKDDCFYCGEPPAREATDIGKVIVLRNGIDRIDSLQGYTQGNVVTSCTRCNQAKNNMSTNEFYALVRKIFSRHCAA